MTLEFEIMGIILSVIFDYVCSLLGRPLTTPRVLEAAEADSQSDEGEEPEKQVSHVFIWVFGCRIGMLVMVWRWEWECIFKCRQTRTHTSK